MSLPSTKTLNIIYTVPSLAPGICQYFPNVGCALQDLLSNLVGSILNQIFLKTSSFAKLLSYVLIGDLLYILTPAPSGVR
jgi:hypothetical protein